MTTEERSGRVLARRNPGEAPGLWRVDVLGTGPVGLMVTTRERWPRPVAFVLGTGPAQLAKALAIYAENRRGGTRRSWRRWAGFVMLPVNSRGRRITRGFVKSLRYTPDGNVALGVVNPEGILAAGGAV